MSESFLNFLIKLQRVERLLGTSNSCDDIMDRSANDRTTSASHSTADSSYVLPKAYTVRSRRFSSRSSVFAHTPDFLNASITSHVPSPYSSPSSSRTSATLTRRIPTPYSSPRSSRRYSL